MRCTLYGFITDYVKDIFIEEILFDIREKLTEVTLGKMKCQDNMHYGDPILVLLTRETLRVLEKSLVCVESTREVQEFFYYSFSHCLHETISY